MGDMLLIEIMDDGSVGIAKLSTEGHKIVYDSDYEPDVDVWEDTETFTPSEALEAIKKLIEDE